MAGELRQLGLRLIPRRSRRSRHDRLDDFVPQPIDGAGELGERDQRLGRRENRVGVLKGSFLPERHEHETEHGEERHGGFGDAASRYPEHFGMVATEPEQ